MSSYEKNAVEIKNEYTTFIMNIMTPSIYEGIDSLYKQAREDHNEFLQKSKQQNIKSPGILKIFQTYLNQIPTLNKNLIEKETNRIISSAVCAEWFDSLIKAVIKSHIILLTMTNPTKKPDILNLRVYESVDTNDFVHKCYVESAKLIYNYPELFWHDFPIIEIKRNQKDIYDFIKKGICEAIRKTLPLKLILKEYLKGDVLKNEDDVMLTLRIKDMVLKDLENDKKNVEEHKQSILVDSDNVSEKHDTDKEIENIKNKVSEIEDSMHSNVEKENPKEEQKDEGTIFIKEDLNEQKAETERKETVDNVNTQDELKKLIDKTNRTLNPTKQRNEINNVVSESMNKKQNNIIG